MKYVFMIHQGSLGYGFWLTGHASGDDGTNCPWRNQHEEFLLWRSTLHMDWIILNLLWYLYALLSFTIDRSSFGTINLFWIFDKSFLDYFIFYIQSVYNWIFWRVHFELFWYSVLNPNLNVIVYFWNFDLTFVNIVIYHYDLPWLHCNNNCNLSFEKTLVFSEE